ncbi:hypothetical protein ABPG75_008017 [Micractinium tetrahymenae]
MSTSSAQHFSVPPSESLWQDAGASELNTLLGSTAPPPSASTTPLSWAWSAACQWFAFLRGLTLAAGTAAAGAVAAGGLAVLLFLVVTASLAPASDTFSRPLSLDFGQPDLAGEAVFLPEAQLMDGLPPAAAPGDARFLPPQQAVDVWAELLVPRGGGQGLAQVVAELTSLDGRVAAKASRVVKLRTDLWSLRSLATAPLRWVGLASDIRRVRVLLFSNYREKAAVPLMVARVAIKTRSSWGCEPEVMSATLKVQLRLGLLRRAVYMLRPGGLLLPLLGAGAVAALLGGTAAAAVLLVLLAITGFGGGGEAAEAAADELGSVAGSDEVEVGSVSGVSEASSSLLRQLSDDEGEPPSPRGQLGMLGGTAGLGGSRAGGGRRVAAERWHDPLLSEAGGSGSSLNAGGRVLEEQSRRKPAGGAQRPADSAMGSEPGGSGRLLAGALRRRAGSAKPANSL